MKALILAFAAAVALAGCSIHTKEQMAAVRAAGVSPRTVARLESRAPISPEDVIELRRHRVDDSVPLRHIDRVGVDYVVNKDDVKAMRAARVNPEVADSLTDASRRFAADRYAPRRRWYWGFDYYDPYPYYWPAVSLGYAWGGYHSYHHDDYHGHHGHHHGH